MSMPTLIMYFRKCVLPIVFLTLCFCAESDEIIRRKLDIVLKDDLEAILGPDTIVDTVALNGGVRLDTAVNVLTPDALIDEPHFVLLDYRKYKEGAYSRMAIADFFFLRPVGNKAVKITRKYRYHKRFGMWDRYYNKYYTVILDGGSVDGMGSADAGMVEATEAAVFDGEPVRAIGGRPYGPGIEKIGAAGTASEIADDNKK